MNTKETEHSGPLEDNTEEVQREQNQFLKTALNVCRSRALSLNAACKTVMSDVDVPSEMKNYEYLREQIRGLHNEVTVLRTFQSSVDVIHNNITCLVSSRLSDPNLRRQIRSLAAEISFFHQSFANLYNNNIDEMENIRRKQDYCMMLHDFKTKLGLLKKQQEQLSQTAEDSRRWQKAENQVRKINFMREMKLILLGKFAGNDKDYPNLQQFRTPFRKLLMVEDFSETWDVGLQGKR